MTELQSWFFFIDVLHLVEFTGIVGANVLHLERYHRGRLADVRGRRVISESTNFVKTGGNPPSTQRFCQDRVRSSRGL